MIRGAVTVVLGAALAPLLITAPAEADEDIGLREAEMALVGGFIARGLEHAADGSALDAIRREVESLCRRFPLYPGRWNDTA